MMWGFFFTVLKYKKDTFDNAKKNGGKCPISNAKGLEKPAYLVEWTRFGNVNKFKWSRNGWTRM